MQRSTTAQEQWRLRQLRRLAAWHPDEVYVGGSYQYGESASARMPCRGAFGRTLASTGGT